MEVVVVVEVTSKRVVRSREEDLLEERDPIEARLSIVGLRALRGNVCPWWLSSMAALLFERFGINSRREENSFEFGIVVGILVGI